MHIRAHVVFLLLVAIATGTVLSKVSSDQHAKVVEKTTDQDHPIDKNQANPDSHPPETSPNTLVLSKLHISVETSDGVGDVSESLDLGKPLSSMPTLHPGDTLRLSFQLESASNQPIRAHQAFITFQGQQITFSRVMKSVSNGKHKLDFKLKPDSQDLYRWHPGLYDVFVIIGQAGIADGIHEKLATINLAYPTPNQDDLDKVERKQGKEFTVSSAEFHSYPEIIFHAQPDPQLPPLTISLVFAVLSVVVPWMVLLGMWIPLGVNIKGINTGMAWNSVFYASLVGHICVLWYYWTQSTILPTLTSMLAVGAVSVLSGRYTLSNLAKQHR